MRLVQRALKRPLEEARCLIIGGGAVGLGAALVLSARGAPEIHIAETNPARRPIVARAGDFRETADAIFRGLLGTLDWPEIRPLSEGARAFDEIRAGRAAAPKIILMP